jgi:hypothetical protein
MLPELRLFVYPDIEVHRLNHVCGFYSTSASVFFDQIRTLPLICDLYISPDDYSNDAACLRIVLSAISSTTQSLQSAVFSWARERWKERKHDVTFRSACLAYYRPDWSAYERVADEVHLKLDKEVPRVYRAPIVAHSTTNNEPKTERSLNEQFLREFPLLCDALMNSIHDSFNHTEPFPLFLRTELQRRAGDSE